MYSNVSYLLHDCVTAESVVVVYMRNIHIYIEYIVLRDGHDDPFSRRLNPHVKPSENNVIWICTVSKGIRVLNKQNALDIKCISIKCNMEDRRRKLK